MPRHARSARPSRSGAAAAPARRVRGGRHAEAKRSRTPLPDLCEAADLPAPLVNHPVAGKAVDFLFAAQRLIVEIDSRRYHRTCRAFDADRARDALHLRSGHRTVRLTHRQLEHDPRTVAATVRALLAQV